MTMQKLLLPAALMLVLVSCAHTTFQSVRAFERGDYSSALRGFEERAALGDVDAQFFLGLMYDEGKGVEANADEAVRYYEIAARRGHLAASNNLGLCYFSGRGVPKDTRRAIELYQEAAASSFAPAITNLGVLRLFGYRNGDTVEGQNLADARRLLERASELGDTKALRILGFLHRQGLGVPKDERLSRTYYERAATAGDLTAHYYLATLYLGPNEGFVDTDAPADPSNENHARGVEHMRIAAEGGLAPAQFGMGLVYLRGIKVDADAGEARAWMQRAAEQGLRAAKDKLAVMTAAAPTR